MTGRLLLCKSPLQVVSREMETRCKGVLLEEEAEEIEMLKKMATTATRTTIELFMPVSYLLNCIYMRQASIIITVIISSI